MGNLEEAGEGGGGSDGPAGQTAHATPSALYLPSAHLVQPVCDLFTWVPRGHDRQATPSALYVSKEHARQRERMRFMPCPGEQRPQDTPS